MRLLNNVRFTALSKGLTERQALEARFVEWFGEEARPLFEEQDLAQEGMNTLYASKLWIDKQRFLRLFVERLQELPEDVRVRLVRETTQRLDTRLHYSFRFDKRAFLDGELRLADRGDVIQVRCNLAAHPKNAQSAGRVVEELFKPGTFK